MRAWIKKTKNLSKKNRGLLFAGIICTILGGTGTALFLREISAARTIPPGQVAARLILPHVALLTGLGLILAAVIIAHKNRVLAQRQNEK
ncbi:MAG: hypothetical protein ACNA71_04415 [Kiritimatiellia bacterium]